MNLLSLDLSTKKTGYAVFIDGELKDYGLIDSTGNGNYQERILTTREKILKKIKEFKIEIIALEEVPMQANKNLITAHDLCVCQGVILDICCMLELGLKLFFPSSWRSAVGTYDGTREGMKRDVQKEKAVSLANLLFGLDLRYFLKDSKKKGEFSDDDIAEAILLGVAFLKENQ